MYPYLCSGAGTQANCFTDLIRSLKEGGRGGGAGCEKGVGQEVRGGGAGCEKGVGQEVRGGGAGCEKGVGRK